MKKIHVNSNGMCGVRLGEISNLILGALCEHMGEGEGGVRVLRVWIHV